MRFKQGSKVEVMSKKEVLTGWRGAEIISGNGHTYSVKYDCYPAKTSDVFVERVPGKVIRPCPPLVEGVDSWVAGEVVEVFDDDLWKIATVLQVYGGDYYMIRLLGLSCKLRVHKLHIRVRQSWEGDKWIVMGKGSRNSGDLRFGLLSTSDGYRRMSFQTMKANATVTSQGEDEVLAVQNNTGFQGSPIASCRTLKRASPYCSYLLEAHTGNVQKIRAVENEDRRQRVVPSTVLEKDQRWRHVILASKCPMMMLGIMYGVQILFTDPCSYPGWGLTLQITGEKQYFLHALCPILLL